MSNGAQEIRRIAAPGSLLKQEKPEKVRVVYRPISSKPPKKMKPRNKNHGHYKRPGMSEPHLACVRQLPCCICAAPGPNDPHHLMATGERGMAMKSPDRWAVPMCRKHHDEVQTCGTKNELRWFAERGIADVLMFATHLWEVTGEVPQMFKVWIKHRRFGP